MANLIFFTLLVCFSLPQDLFAERSACRAVDLRPALGEARDQGASGWCFAHTTADLITQKLGVRVSAFDLATTFLLGDVRSLPRMSSPLAREYFRLEPGFVERVVKARLDDQAYQAKQIFTAKGLLNVGGIEDLALVAANTKGLCLDSRLPSESTPHVTYENYLASIDHFSRTLSPSHRNSLRQRYSYLEHITDPQSLTSVGAFQTWVDFKCGARVPAGELIPQQFYIAEDADGLDLLPPKVSRKRQKLLQQVIGHLLDEGRAVAIGYDANDVMPRDAADTERHADHSSIIAARRPTAAHGCEVFVRNSFGPDCDDFRPELKSACEAGGVWVNFDQLPSLYSAVWLDE